MLIWYLTMWTMTATPFEGGQYQTYDKCVTAAKRQSKALGPIFGSPKLKWKCTLERV